MDFIQNIYIKLLTPCWSLTGRLSEKTRYALLQALYLVGFGYFIISRSRILRHKFFVGFIEPMPTRHILGTILLIIIAILTINGLPHKVRWRKTLICLQILTGLGIIAISFLHPIGDGYRIFGFQLVFIFPLFYFVWNNNGDYKRLIRQIVIAVVVMGMLLYVGTFYFAFQGRLVMEAQRCAGIMSRTNCFSLVGMELVLGGIYILATEKPGWIRLLFAGAAIGMGIGTILTGQMRIAILTIILCTVFTVYYCLIHLNKRPSKRVLLDGLVILMMALVFTEASTAMVNINNKALERKKQIEATVVEDSTGAEDDDLDTKENLDYLVDRLAPNVDTGDAYSSGRISIWKNYASKLNLLGNDFDQYDAAEMTGQPGLNYAHNIFFEISYRCGIPVGIIAMLFYITEGIICIGFLFCKADKKPDYLLFPVICAIAFALEALLDCAVFPFFQAEALLYYISIALAADKELR